jgi:hypothetical protein
MSNWSAVAVPFSLEAKIIFAATGVYKIAEWTVSSEYLILNLDTCHCSKQLAQIVDESV